MWYLINVAFSLFLLPLGVNAAWSVGDPIIPCTNDCTFGHLLVLAGNVIGFLVLYLATPLVIIAIAYAGVLLITQGGNPGTRATAQKILWYAVLGFAVSLAAWLIVDTILDALLKSNPLP